MSVHDVKLGVDDLPQLLARRWPSILLSLALFVGAAIWFDAARPVEYVGETTVLVAPTAAQQSVEAGRQINPAALDRQLDNEIRVATSDLAAQLVRLELDLEPDAEPPEIEVTAPEAGDVLLFEAKADRPGDAALHSDAWAEAYVQVRQTIAQENINEVTEEIRQRLDELRAERELLVSGVQELQDRLVRAPEAERERIRLEIDREDAAVAADVFIVDAQIGATIQSITELQTSASLGIAGSARIVDRSEVPESPAGPPLAQLLVLALVLGAIVGCGVAVMRHGLDNKVRTLDDVQQLGISVVGEIPRAERKLRRTGLAMASRDHPSSGVAAAYQQSRTAIRLSGGEKRYRALLVTSPTQGNGKTTTVLNLALAFALADRRTFVVDGDMRRPRIHEAADLSRAPGLSDVLVGDADWTDAVQAFDVPGRRPLSVLTAGSPVLDPAAIVSLEQFGEVVEAMSKSNEMVIVDAPPVLPVADAAAMAGAVDGVVLVATAGKTTRNQLAETVGILSRADALVIGVLLVGTNRTARQYRYEEKRFALPLVGSALDRLRGRGPQTAVRADAATPERSRRPAVNGSATSNGSMTSVPSPTAQAAAPPASPPPSPGVDSGPAVDTTPRAADGASDEQVAQEPRSIDDVLDGTDGGGVRSERRNGGASTSQESGDKTLEIRDLGGSVVASGTELPDDLIDEDEY